jgi:hypothetical protein
MTVKGLFTSQQGELLRNVAIPNLTGTAGSYDPYWSNTSGIGAASPAAAAGYPWPAYWPHLCDVYVPQNTVSRAFIAMGGAGDTKEHYAFLLNLCNTNPPTQTTCNWTLINYAQSVMIIPQAQVCNGHESPTNVDQPPNITNNYTQGNLIAGPPFLNASGSTAGPLGTTTWNNGYMQSGWADLQGPYGSTGVAAGFIYDCYTYFNSAPIISGYQMPVIPHFCLAGHSNGGFMTERWYYEGADIFQFYFVTSGPLAGLLSADPVSAANYHRPFWAQFGALDNVVGIINSGRTGADTSPGPYGAYNFFNSTWLEPNSEVSVVDIESIGTVSFTGAGFVSGANSGTLTTNWPYPSGSYQLNFSSGDQPTATLTNGSTAVTWAPNLTGIASANPVCGTANSNHVGAFTTYLSKLATVTPGMTAPTPQEFVQNIFEASLPNHAVPTSVASLPGNIYQYVDTSGRLCLRLISNTDHHLQNQTYAIPNNAGTNSTSSMLLPWLGFIQSTTTTYAQPVTFSVAGGTYASPQTVTLASTTSGPGFEIYYTTDGSTPSTGYLGPVNGTLYSGPITVSASETVQACCTATGLAQSMVSSATYVITSLSVGYVGVGALDTVNYYTSSQPFLDVFKFANGNPSTYAPWDTVSPSGYGDDINYDANGFPTSLNSINGLNGGSYSAVQVSLWVNIIGSGQVQPSNTGGLNYPSGQYTLVGVGPGTMTISGSSITGLASAQSGSGITITQPGGLWTIVSTLTGAWSLTFNASGTGGMVFSITSLPSGPTNYIKGLHCYQTALASNFAAGELFLPAYKTMLSALNVSCLRFMSAQQTDSVTPPIQFGPTAVSSGATSAVMQTYNYGTSSWQNAPWMRTTGTYYVQFANGQAMNCTLTLGSATISFSSALTSSIAFIGDYNPQAAVALNRTWASRPLATDFSYATCQGVPLEVCLQLCNELNCDAHINQPCGSDSSYAAGMAALCFNGTGSTIAGFTGLPRGTTPAGTPQSVLPEWSNEVWNPTYIQQQWVSWAGSTYSWTTAPPSYEQGQSYFGIQQAELLLAFKAEYGSTLYLSNVFRSMGNQFAWSAANGQASNGVFYMNVAMTTPGWSGGPAYSVANINSIHYAPYINFQPSSAQAVTFTANPSGTSGTLNSPGISSPTGKYPFVQIVVFNSGTLRNVTITAANQTALTWSGSVSETSPSAQVGEQAAILSYSTQALQLNAIFGLTYSNTYAGITYSVCGSWAATAGPISSGLLAGLATIGASTWWPQITMKRTYEAGTQIVGNGVYSTAFGTLVYGSTTGMAFDYRLGLVYYDPTNVLGGGLGYINGMLAAGWTEVNFLEECEIPSKYGFEGLANSVMQPVALTANAPPCATACAAWALAT